MENKQIERLIKMSKFKNSNIPLLLEDAYKIGLFDGKELAKERMTEAIKEEK